MRAIYFKIFNMAAGRSYARILLFILFSGLLYSCSDSPLKVQFLRSGNKHYEKKEYDDALSDYIKALNEDGKDFRGYFNYGDALYRKKDTSGAQAKFESALQYANTKPERSMTSYNTGNANTDNKKWEPAIEAYKTALKNNPNDKDAKYNLCYALEKLKKEQEQNKKNKNKNNKDKKDSKDKKDGDKKQDQKNGGDKNKDQKDKNGDKKEGDKGDKKDQQKQGGQGDKEKEQKGAAKEEKGKISDEQAQKILVGLKDAEQKVQKKMLLKAAKEKATSHPKTEQW